MPEPFTYMGKLEDKAFGIGDGFDYDRFKRWIEAQPFSFKKSLTFEADLVSANWNGATPLDLSAVDSAATVGFALDASAGAAQFEGSVFVGGTLQSDNFVAGSTGWRIRGSLGDAQFNGAVNIAGALTVGGATSLTGTLTFGTGGVFRTAASGSRIQISTAFGDQIEWHGSSGSPGYIYGSETAGSGDGTHRVLSIWSPAEDSNDYVSIDIWAGADGGSQDGGSPRIVIGGGAGLTDDVQLRIMDGNNLIPSLAFDADGNTGIYRAAADDIAITAGGVLKARFAVPGSGINTRIPGINDTTTGSAPNVFINSSTSLMARSTSSLRFKPGWEWADEDFLADLELPNAITWMDDMGGLMLGFGVEHLEQMDPRVTQDWDDDGRPENYDVRSLVAILSAKVKRLEKRLA